MTGGPFSLFAHVGSKLDNPKKQIMTIEEYKAQVFKYDGEGPVTIGDEWPHLPRAVRREIERLVRKGKNPDIASYL